MPEQLPNIEPVAIALQTGRDETPRVDSRELAQRLGVKHKNTIELLDKHKADFLELGVLPFQTEKPSGRSADGAAGCLDRGGGGHGPVPPIL